MESAENNPDVENLSNSNNASVYSAIDAFCNSTEESYEKFLNGFSHLNKETLISQPLFNNSASCMEPGQQTVQLNNGTLKHTFESENVNEDDGDKMEQEIFGDENERIFPNILMRTDDRPGKTLVKMDNFLDGSDSEEDQESDSASYQCSFVSSNAEKENFINCDTKSSTASVLNNSPRSPVSDITLDTQSRLDRSDISEDFQSFPMDHLNTGSHDFKTSDPSWDTIINPGEVEVISATRTEQDLVFLRHLDISTQVGNDATEKRFGKSTGDNASEVVHNNVEPFLLDDTFDYDNVVLTPKWSKEELVTMSSFKDLS